MRLTPKRRSAAAVALAVLGSLFTAGAGSTVAAASDVPPSGPSETFAVDVPRDPGSSETIGIDSDLYLPAGSEPAPAVLLAHGFGASKSALAGEAERLRGLGFVVLAYSARGFGDSGGRIALDSLDYEVADARALVDLLADRPEVQRVGADPVVGVAGASYGGALALMLGATDDRIDAVVASITWNDLADALLPQSATPVSNADADSQADAAPGVFKQAWVSQLLGGVASPRSGPCGRFTEQLCALYTDLVAGAPLDAEGQALLARSSPSTVLDGMTAPTLLLQGQNDTLFGLDQADANAKQIAAAGAPVQVTWFAGGHDAGNAQVSGVGAAVDGWLQTHLMDADAAGPTGGEPLPFQYVVPTSARSFAETRTAPAYPGLGDGSATVVTDDQVRTAIREVPLEGDWDRVVNPPGGVPAIVTSLPGVGAVDARVEGVDPLIPDSPGRRAQSARWVSAPIEEPFVLTGAPTVRLYVASGRPRDETVAPASEAVLFAQLRVISGDSSAAVGGGGVAPLRIALSDDGEPVAVDVQLSAASWRVEEGDRLALVVRTTDTLYRGSPDAASFALYTAGPLALPTVQAGDPVGSAGAPSSASLTGIATVLTIAALLLTIAALIGRRRRRTRSAPTRGPALTAPGPPASLPTDAPPLVVRGLTKDYRNGLRAVDDLSFTVRRGQVLGLLGPNGAGKTTALRMVTGLLRPDAGAIEIFGEPVVPGSEVLTRVGCFIEGPGFLPHLSGTRNLELFWAASGRPAAEARMAEALAIADLGTAVRRRVGGYSQGMRQRLAIAQAMLGMPELLILDEPTNGLDPPQIHALRGVLRRYAASGRTVIVSSHLLGEVEVTCTDVVVMSHGHLIAAGTVAELAGEATELTIEVTDVESALDAVAGLAGALAWELAPGVVRITPSGHSPESIVGRITARGVGVRSVRRGRHLEETFLAMIDQENRIEPENMTGTHTAGRGRAGG